MPIQTAIPAARGHPRSPAVGSPRRRSRRSPTCPRRWTSSSVCRRSIRRRRNGGEARPPPRRAGSGPVSYRSDVINAPERFDLVGLAGELRPLEIRARDTAGSGANGSSPRTATRSTSAAPTSSSCGRAAGGPGAPFTTSTCPGRRAPLGGLLTGARAGDQLRLHLGLGSGRAAGRRDAHPAARSSPGQPGAPTGCDGGCSAARSPVYGTVKAAVIHHTVTANDYSEAEAPAIVLGICRYHRNANGWNDIGYQRARRPLRQHLPGTRRRHQAAGRRRPGAGLQRADHRRSRRSAPTRRAPITPATQDLDRQLPRLEAGGGTADGQAARQR